MLMSLMPVELQVVTLLRCKQLVAAATQCFSPRLDVSKDFCGNINGRGVANIIATRSSSCSCSCSSNCILRWCRMLSLWVNNIATFATKLKTINAPAPDIDLWTHGKLGNALFGNSFPSCWFSSFLPFHSTFGSKKCLSLKSMNFAT